MTVASTLSKVTLSGNGATRAWPFSFPVKDASHLRVVITNPDGAQTTLANGYTVTLTSSGGTVTYPVSGSPLAAGYKITLRRVVPLTQETALANQDGFYAEVHEDRFDLLAMADQQQQEQLDRSVKAPATDTVPFELPTQEARATRIMGFDADGRAVAANTSVEALDALTLQALQAGLVSDVIQPFVSDGVQTVIPTTVPLMSQAQVTLLVGGVLQPPNSGAYTVTKTPGGGTITLAEPAPAGVTVGGYIGFAKEVTGEVPLANVVGLSDQLAGKLATDGDASQAVVTATGGTAALPLSKASGGRVDVRHWGAVGDGVTDDTAALQAAINTMNAEGWQRHLYLPRLSHNGYRITSPLLLTADRSRLVGDAPMMTPILLDNADGTMSAIKIGYQVAQINGCALTDLVFTRAQAGSASAAVDCNKTGATDFTRTRVYGDNKYAVGFSLLSGSAHAFRDTSAENCTVAGYKLRGSSGGAANKLIDTFLYGTKASGCAIGHDWGDYVEGVFWDLLYAFNSTTALQVHGTSSGTGPAVMKGSLLELDTCSVAADLDYAYNFQAADMWISNVSAIGIKLGRADTIHVRIGTGYTNSGATLVDIGNGTDAINNVVLASVNGGSGAIGIRVRANASGVVIGPHRLRSYTTAAIQIDGGDRVTIEPGSYAGNTGNITGAAAATNSLILETVSGGVRINGGATLATVSSAAQISVGSDLLMNIYRGSGSAGDTRIDIVPQSNGIRLVPDGAAANIGRQDFTKGSGIFEWGQQGGLDTFLQAYRAGGVSAASKMILIALDNGFRFQAEGPSSDAFVQLLAKGAGNVLIGSSTNKVGFYGGAGAAKQAVTGSRGGNAALASLITALAALGLITDSTAA